MKLRPHHFVVLILVCGPVYAEQPIDTDGPDFVESSEAVGKGRFQFEMDFVSEGSRRDAAQRRSTSLPTLLRYGIAESVELRAEGDIFVRESTRDNGMDSTASGHGDVALGLKWHAQDRDEAKNVPAVSWILHFDTPSGSGEFRGRGIRPSLRSVVTWDFGHGLYLGVMPGLLYDTREDGHRFTSGILGIVAGKWITERYRMFVESSSSQIARAENGGVVSAWDIGAAYLLSHDWQLGGRIGVAANRNTPRSTIVLELAGRF